MKTQKDLREAYLKLMNESDPMPGITQGTFVCLDELRLLLNMRVRTFIQLIIKARNEGNCSLAKAPAAFKERRYEIDGEEWTFFRFRDLKELRT